jgi:hypothetical protein
MYIPAVVEQVGFQPSVPLALCKLFATGGTFLASRKHVTLFTGSRCFGEAKAVADSREGAAGISAKTARPPLRSTGRSSCQLDQELRGQAGANGAARNAASQTVIRPIPIAAFRGPSCFGPGEPFSGASRYVLSGLMARGVGNRVFSWRGASTTGVTHARLRLHHHRCRLRRLRAR